MESYLEFLKAVCATAGAVLLVGLAALAIKLIYEYIKDLNS